MSQFGQITEMQYHRRAVNLELKDRNKISIQLYRLNYTRCVLTVTVTVKTGAKRLV